MKANIERILTYVTDLREITTDVKNGKELSENKLVRYAATQLITNIYEDSKLIRNEQAIDEDLQAMLKELRLTRNLISHSYLEVDFKLVSHIIQVLKSRRFEKCLKKLLV